MDSPAQPSPDFDSLRRRFSGELHTDPFRRALYATDASVYSETPLAVAYPRDEADIAALVAFAREHRIGLIPRTAGTSLAGQVVGPGIVVDVSRHFTRILEIDPAARRARVQPGVVRNELNLALRPHGLFFAPETSTANRAMIGGMLGNNSCGSNSLVYGSTREHVVAVRGLLSDGSVAEFGPLTAEELAQKGDAGPPAALETRLYRGIREILGNPASRAAIRRTAPHPEIHRRNTGYALEALLDTAPFADGASVDEAATGARGLAAPTKARSTPACDTPFNFCRLIAGSEGTLVFVTEITVNCEPLPPPESALVVVHCHTVDEALRANLVALRHGPFASELIDRPILECTRANLEQARNRFFLVGDPGAILVVELRAAGPDGLAAAIARLEADLRAASLGHAWPVVRGADQNRVWELRRAGLGLLSNTPGDAKPVAVVEDTAVRPADLPAYIAEFDRLLADRHGLRSVHYAHAGSGELHLRPILNLKDPADVRRFRAVAEDVAALVLRYRGSLSGEHGDGRLRAEFIRRIVGEEVHTLFVRLKRTWDPDGVFNPGKIVDAPPMDTHLRYRAGQATADIATFFDFGGVAGMQRAAELCNGSGDCRKTHLAGGTMCPSYMATRDEKDTTRARANLLRQVITARAAERHPLDSDDLAAVLDLCLSCKGCKAECPSNVDMARLRAEFLQQRYDARGTPWRARLVGAMPRLLRLAALAPRLSSALSRGWTGQALKRAAGFHPARSLPRVSPTTLRSWLKHRERAVPISAATFPEDGHREAGTTGRGDAAEERFVRRPAKPAAMPEVGRRGCVWLLADEFTDTLDAAIGVKAVELLERLGYAVDLAPVRDTGRALLSKGLLRRATRLASHNVAALHGPIGPDRPLVGIEPSALLSFRDEYPDLLRGDEAARARELARHCLTIDEFLVREAEAGRIGRADFAPFVPPRKVVLHGHCHQKALVSIVPTVRMLELVEGCRVQVLPSGCCGMAGAFGYEREHFELSMKVGELVLFPAVRSAAAADIVAAPGTSCRHQIMDGTGRVAQHPLEILADRVVGHR